MSQQRGVDVREVEQMFRAAAGDASGDGLAGEVGRLTAGDCNTDSRVRQKGKQSDG